ncbi:hypothetical protein GCM10023323_51380 [Streptomyces thinghirensis]|uniref:Uncharacterized protein n=1 Tax=Streptomyces thinghirensis TaxID=551547 RepID=A0ABP9TBU9_9ACTN
MYQGEDAGLLLTGKHHGGTTGGHGGSTGDTGEHKESGTGGPGGPSSPASLCADALYAAVRTVAHLPAAAARRPIASSRSQAWAPRAV